MEAFLKNKSEYSTKRIDAEKYEFYFGQVQVVGFVFDNFKYTNEDGKIDPLPEEDLTSMCLAVSETSLKQDWDNEDDAYWENYLKE